MHVAGSNLDEPLLGRNLILMDLSLSFAFTLLVSDAVLATLREL